MPNSVQRYPSKTVWITSGDYLSDQTVSGSLAQVPRIQSADWTLSYPYNYQSYADGGGDSSYLTANGVDLTLRWLVTNGAIDPLIGLTQGISTGRLQFNLAQEKNIYVAIQDGDGVDAALADSSLPRTVIGFAQGVVMQYGLRAAVGSFVEASTVFNCLTADIYSGASGQIVPSVAYQNGAAMTGLFIIPQALTQFNRASSSAAENIAALGPYDIELSFSNSDPFGIVFSGVNKCYLQSFDLNLGINHQEQKHLGYKYPSARPVVYPIQIDLNTEAIVSKYQRDQLQRLTACAAQSALITVQNPCAGTPLVWYSLEDLRLVDQSFTSAIGNLDRVSSKWQGYIKTPSPQLDDTFSISLSEIENNMFVVRWGADYYGIGSTDCGGGIGVVESRVIRTGIDVVNNKAQYYIYQNALAQAGFSLGCGVTDYVGISISSADNSEVYTFYGPGGSVELSMIPSRQPWTFVGRVHYSFNQFPGSAQTVDRIDVRVQNTDYDAYFIERSIDSGVTFEPLYSVGNKPSYVDSGVVSGITYMYRTRAIKNGLYSNWSPIISGTL